MNPESGIVQAVSIGPGRPDTIFVLFEKETGSGHMLNAADGDVTCDGAKVTAPELFAWLIEHEYPVKATLYPDGNHYGNAMKAEFTSKES